MRHDLTEVLVPGRVLTVADVIALQRVVGAPAWQVRRLRLDVRDEALREALETLSHLGPTNAAKKLERALAAFQRGAAVPSELVDTLSRVIEMHGPAQPLSWKQISRIGRGARTPESCA